MATSFKHAEASVRHFKAGKPEDYLHIHEFIDSTKKQFGDVRHRAFFHNTYGPWICQELFGVYIEVETSTGKTIKVGVREIAEKHIIEDLGCIPSVGDWLNCMDCKTWMGGKRNKFIGREDFLETTVKEAK